MGRGAAAKRRGGGVNEGRPAATTRKREADITVSILHTTHQPRPIPHKQRHLPYRCCPSLRLLAARPSPRTMVSKVLFWSGFGTPTRPPPPHRSTHARLVPHASELANA